MRRVGFPPLHHAFPEGFLMSTMLKDTEEGQMVYILVSQGRQPKIPREGVLVPYEDPPLLLAVATEQATAARKIFGLTADNKEPVD